MNTGFIIPGQIEPVPHWSTARLKANQTVIVGAPGSEPGKFRLVAVSTPCEWDDELEEWVVTPEGLELVNATKRGEDPEDLRLATLSSGGRV